MRKKKNWIPKKWEVVLSLLVITEIALAEFQGLQHTMQPKIIVCPTRTDLSDVQSKAFVAPLVFDGIARSKSPTEQRSHTYEVSIEVIHMYKGKISLHSLIHLKFIKSPVHKEELNSINPTTRWKSASQIIPRKLKARKNSKAPNCLVEADLKTGKSYIFFASKQYSPENYSAIAEPVLKTERKGRLVREILCNKCATKPSVFGLKNETVLIRNKMKLRCRTRGKPSPEIRWFKNGRRLHPSRHVKIRSRKRKSHSTLRIRRVVADDRGIYECGAINIIGKSSNNSKAYIEVLESYTQTNNVLDSNYGMPKSVELNPLIRRREKSSKIYTFKSD